VLRPEILLNKSHRKSVDWWSLGILDSYLELGSHHPFLMKPQLFVPFVAGCGASARSLSDCPQPLTTSPLQCARLTVTPCRDVLLKPKGTVSLTLIRRSIKTVKHHASSTRIRSKATFQCTPAPQRHQRRVVARRARSPRTSEKQKRSMKTPKLKPLKSHLQAAAALTPIPERGARWRWQRPLRLERAQAARAHCLHAKAVSRGLVQCRGKASS
jgi:serine/threonine protein kinase